MAAQLLAGRINDFLMTKSIPGIYRYFRAGGQIQRSPSSACSILKQEVSRSEG